MQGYLKLVERKGSALFWSLTMRAFSRHFQPALGLRYHVKDYRYEDCTHYISTADLAGLTSLLKETIGTQSDYWEWYLNRCRELGDQLVHTAQRLGASIPAGTDVQRFQEGFESFTEATKNVMPFLLSTSIAERLVEEQLRHAIQQESTVAAGIVDGATVLAELRASAAPNAPLEEMRHCYQLAWTINDDQRLRETVLRLSADAFIEELRVLRPELEREIASHVEQYGWLRTYAYRFEPMRQADLIERIRTVIRLNRIPRWERPRQGVDLRSILSREPSDELRRWASLIEQLVAVRFYRSTVHWRADTLARPFFHALAASQNMSRNDLVFCTEDELLAGLQGGRFPDLCELRLREQNWYNMRLLDDVIALETNAAPSMTASRGLPLTLKGSTASMGRVVGRARIVLSAEDRRDVREGDIVVTTMTTPDFMDVLEKCAGIVTDEGGILCHAAVISRELNVPCIIGTGEASHMLRNNMTIEMDATQAEGIVNCVHDAEETDGGGVL